MDLIEMYGELTTEPCEFAIYSGGPLRSNNPAYIERARRMEAAGKLRIYENLSKNEYYALLNNTRVLFNCALQDWVSNTVSEADTLGCNVGIQRTAVSLRPLPMTPTGSMCLGALMMLITRCRTICVNHITTWA